MRANYTPEELRTRVLAASRRLVARDIYPTATKIKADGVRAQNVNIQRVRNELILGGELVIPDRIVPMNAGIRGGRRTGQPGGARARLALFHNEPWTKEVHLEARHRRIPKRPHPESYSRMACEAVRDYEKAAGIRLTKHKPYRRFKSLTMRLLHPLDRVLAPPQSRTRRPQPSQPDSGSSA